LRRSAWVATGSSVGVCDGRDGRPAGCGRAGRPGLLQEPALVVALDPEDEETLLRPVLTPLSISRR
jgi:hypothetical protein